MATLALVLLRWLGVDADWDRGAMWYMVAPLSDLSFVAGVLVGAVLVWPKR